MFQMWTQEKQGTVRQNQGHIHSADYQEFILNLTWGKSCPIFYLWHENAWAFFHSYNGSSNQSLVVVSLERLVTDARRKDDIETVNIFVNIAEQIKLMLKDCFAN